MPLNITGESDDEMSNSSSKYTDLQAIPGDVADLGAPGTNSSSDGGGILDGLLGQNTSINVNRLKCMVYLVLVTAATGFALAVFFSLKQEEVENFEIQFGDFSQEILSSAEANSRDYLGRLEGVSNTLTSYSLDTEAKFPNITLPHFDKRTTDSFEKLAGAEVFIYAPIVTKVELPGYESFAWEHQGWIRKDLELRGLGKLDPGLIPARVYPSTGELEAHLNAKIHVPVWEISPVPTDAKIVNLDLYSHPSFKRMIDECTTVRHLLLSEVVDRTFISDNIETLDSSQETDRHPRSYAVQPVFRDFSVTSELVGFVFAVVPWWTYFVNVLPVGVNGYVVEIQDTCGSAFFYRLDGPEATYLEDFTPNPDLAHLSPSEEFAVFARFTGENTSDDILHCSYRLVVHPSDQLTKEYETTEPIIYTVVVIAVFAITALVFVFYDYFVQQRQDRVMRTAQKTSTIVSSLFPKTVQTRIMQDMRDSSFRSVSSRRFSGRDMLKKFLGNDMHGEPGENGLFTTKPIADFFPATTIFFADIVGFTQWSSSREPQSVFTLLETIYHEFDSVATRRKIFKVETIGDCYMATCGLPDPRPDHALCIARFSLECLTRFASRTKSLEVELGPDTGDLGMRMGIHSGPVTGGVLRGTNARFQLFGDTVNTASRMESTGKRGMIQLSQETADLLKEAGKEHWLVAREDLVEAKGKGSLQTYWLQCSKNTDTESAAHSKSTGSVGPPISSIAGKCDVEGEDKSAALSFVSKSGERLALLPGELSDKVVRLVNWNVDILMAMLQEVEANRLSTGVTADHRDKVARLEYQIMRRPSLVITEAQEIISFPEYTQEPLQHDPRFITIGEPVQRQLRQFLLGIASMYPCLPFHSFPHAANVTLSAVKLFHRIVAPDKDKVWDDDGKSLHDHTYGLTSDPLTQLAVVMAAIFHDVQHPGVPNSQMSKEQMEIAIFYEHKSVAEQNSVDLAWALLMKKEFQDLRRAIYKTEAELKRFRQLIVNAVLATDIMDPDLKALRNNRWSTAFESEPTSQDDSVRSRSLKATVVIEYLMQASDVSHTMQHWSIYLKWNRRLFEEMHMAYVEGRAEKDPGTFWFQGEIGFFDFYIIPLAKKLKNCGVFGVSSDECLHFATSNRNEWMRTGEAIVKEFTESTRRKKVRKSDLIASSRSPSFSEIAFEFPERGVDGKLTEEFERVAEC